MLLSASKYKADQATQGYCLAKIPSFSGLTPRAQRRRIPVYEVPDNLLGVGTVLEQYKTIRDRFLLVFNTLADDVENMTN
jgi:hypothetical protein